ncbi:1410_t:CDS:1, partial [Cetraspora pellucida]
LASTLYLTTYVYKIAEIKESKADSTLIIIDAKVITAIDL